MHCVCYDGPCNLLVGCYVLVRRVIVVIPYPRDAKLLLDGC